MKAIILAGGSGQRFWPLSTGKKPKQFLKLHGDRSLLRETFDRLIMRFDPLDILVITSAEHVEMTVSELPEIPPINIVGEPMGRNTAPACALGAVIAGSNEIQLVVPADHYISDPERFWHHFDIGYRWLQGSDSLITFGIGPRRPETGYGYLEAGESQDNGIFKVNRFCEKPDAERAEEYMSSGVHFWNSGMFMWKGSTLLDEIRKWEPAIYDELKVIDPSDTDDFRERYSRVPRISIDYAVMERSDRVFMVRSDFPWSDLGNWVSIRELIGYTEDGEGILLEGSDRVYIHGDPGKPVAAIGLKDIVIVDTAEGLLICREDLVQKVRSAYGKFEDSHPG